MENYSLNDVHFYIKSLSDSLKRLHSLQIIHRDVKPSNFLFNKSIKVGLIIDLGLCELSLKARDMAAYKSERKAFYIERILKIQSIIGKNKFGTEGYMPLETVLMSENQTSAVDVWALGVIYLQLLVKKQFLFCQMNLIIFDKSSQKLKKLDNNVALLLIQLANFCGPQEVKAICNSLGYYVSFPGSLTGSMDKIRAYVKFEGVSEVEWEFLKTIIALEPKLRPECREISEFISHLIGNS